MIEGAELFAEEFREEARKEFENKTIESAIKMLKKGYPIEDIIDITGLSGDKINELQSSLTAAA